MNSDQEFQKRKFYPLESNDTETQKPTITNSEDGFQEVSPDDQIDKVL